MQIDAKVMRDAFLSGAKALSNNQEWINELNVFPVPDGDTGTNMTMTIMSAAKEIMMLQEVNVDNICKAISSGALRGARGNSGVILSQLFRGFAKSIQKSELQEIGVPEIAEAMVKATETAYKAVMKPKEGTILTVQRGLSDKAQELKDMENISEYVEAVLAYGDEVLLKTPEMLPVLKQAGVVDSGGQGLMVVLHAMLDALNGKVLEFTSDDVNGARPGAGSGSVDTSNLDTSDIKFGYCTEFIIKLKNPISDAETESFKDFLSSIGDSIVCVADDEIVKIHVHTNDPGLAIQKALTYGELSRMKIDNMREEHEERLFKNASELAEQQKAEEKQMPKKDMGFITCCAGDGLKQIFEDLGADYVIEGGQTMNPSTEDFLTAIDKVNADSIFVLPNNGNIILAANQAAKMVEDKEEGKRIIVIPTSTVCQGLTCFINFDGSADADANAEAMTEAIPTVQTIEVTYAIRDTEIDGVAVHKGDFMALSGKKILNAGTDLQEVVKEAIAAAVTDESSLVSLYYGEDVAETDAEELMGIIQEANEDIEVEANYGGQPVYYYIISVE